MRRSFCLAIFALLVVPCATLAPSPRPSVTGLAFARLRVSDLTAADKFYANDLGLPRVHQCWGQPTETCFFITPYQDIEILKTTTETSPNLLESFGVWTSDASQLRSYLVARGLNPGELKSEFRGEQHFEISDPEGHHVIFLSSNHTLLHVDSRDQSSHHMIHIGFVVQDRSAEDHFYREVLGFRLYWHGGMTEDRDDWVAMQVPEGRDWLEYMLHISPIADKHTLGVMNHIALGVEDINAAKAQLIKNGWRPGEEPKLGRDGKWQLNLYDPDDTRVEFMEFRPKEKPCCSEFTGPHP